MFWKHSSGARPPRFPVSLSTVIRHCHSSFPGALPYQWQTQTARGWPARTKMRVCWYDTRGEGPQGPERLPAAGDHATKENLGGWVSREESLNSGSTKHPRGGQGLTTVCLHILASSSLPSPSQPANPTSPLYRQQQSRNSRLGWE